MISRAFVSAKSKNEDIAFSALLKGCVCEDIILAISKSTLNDKLFLTNLSDYSFESYKEKGKAQDIYYVASEDVASKLYVVLTEWAALSDVDIHGQVEQFGLNLSINTDGMNVALKIYVTVCQNLSGTQSCSFTPSFDNKKTFDVECIRLEWVLALQIQEIFAKMAFIPDVAPYVKAYELIKTVPVKGRFMIDCLGRLEMGGHPAVDIKRMDIILKFSSNSIMKNKWKSYTRAHEISDDFTTVLSALDKFIRPLAKAMEEKQIFLDDWMPGVMRYFD